MQTIQKAERAVAGGYAGAAPNGLEDRPTTTPTPGPSPVLTTTANPDEQRGHKVRAMLRARLGDDIFTSWFNALDFESFESGTVKFSVPVKFLRTWIQSHYSEDLLACCQAEFKGAEKVEVVLRQPGNNNAGARMEAEAAAAAEPTNAARNGSAQSDAGQRGPMYVAPVPAAGRTSGLVFAALRYLGKTHITPERIARLRKTLSPADRKQLLVDLPSAPVWLHPHLRAIAAENPS